MRFRIFQMRIYHVWCIAAVVVLRVLYVYLMYV